MCILYTRQIKIKPQCYIVPLESSWGLSTLIWTHSLAGGEGLENYQAGVMGFTCKMWFNFFESCILIKYQIIYNT